jgi:hypothetical protein
MQIMRLRKVRSITFALVVSVSVLGRPIRLIAQCWGEPTAAVARTTAGYVTGDGIRHVTYVIPSAWGSELTAAIQAAMTEWNSKTSTTKVTFEPFQQGYPSENSIASFEFNLGGTETSCARYVAGDSQELRLHVNLAVAAPQYSGQVKQAVAHELGHMMNIDDSGTAGLVMKPPSYPDCTNTWIPTFPTAGVQQDDADLAPGCINQIVQQGFSYNGGQQTTTEWPVCECWQWVRYTYGYLSNGQGGYTLVVLDRTVLDEGCGTPPY